MAEQLEKKEKAKAKTRKSKNSTPNGSPARESGHGLANEQMEEEEEKKEEYQCKTWIHSIFEGVLTNDTRCLSCETVRAQLSLETRAYEQ